MENVKKFYDALISDEALCNRAKALNDKYEGKQPDEAEVIADLIAFAKTEGYEFTADEYRAFAEKARELDDDELEAVAGGSSLDSPEEHRCVCILIGGGKASVNKENNCFCIIGGSGSKDKNSNLMFSGGSDIKVMLC